MIRQDGKISLAHGNGGRLMRKLIDDIFVPTFGSSVNADLDAAPLFRSSDGEWLITTDGFTVDPLEFPGGDIGSLAVHGTINDLAVSGAQPRYMTLNAFIEEGFEIATLRRITRSIANACNESMVKILAGDTKVVQRGQGGGLYLATTGVGLRAPDANLGMEFIQPGDLIVVSGTIGDHGTAVLLAREQFGLAGDLCSDVASVLPVTSILLRYSGLRFMRDPTRGGIAAVAHEIARSTRSCVRLFEKRLPIRPEVASVCEILGFDPIYLASEGRVVAILAPNQAEAAVASLKAAGFQRACVIGEIESGASHVVMQTQLGGARIIPELEEDPLPRIC